jgi:hypothetical protein
LGLELLPGVFTQASLGRRERERERDKGRNSEERKQKGKTSVVHMF